VALTLIGWTGLILSLAFMVVALGFYATGRRPPRWFRGMLWTIPAAPFVMVACLILLVVGSHA